MHTGEEQAPTWLMPNNREVSTAHTTFVLGHASESSGMRLKAQPLPPWPAKHRPPASQVTLLAGLNLVLPEIYRSLSGAPSCDAHCSFSEAQLFEEGVALVVRPPGDRWRAFQARSGGQGWWGITRLQHEPWVTSGSE